MTERVTAALFAYSPEGEPFLAQLQEYSPQTTIQGVLVEDLFRDPEEYLQDIGRVIVAAKLPGIKKVIQLAAEHSFSIGFIPLPNQKNLAALGGIPIKAPDYFELALATESLDANFLYCNDEIVLFQAVIGDIPLFANQDNIGWVQIVKDGFKKLKTLQLKPFSLATGGDNPRTLATAACGCMVLHNPWSIAARLIAHENSAADGMVSAIIPAPSSIVDYIHLLWRIFSHKKHKSLPRSMGYIKNPEIKINQARRFGLTIDGEPQELTTDTLVFRASPTKISVCTQRREEDSGPEQGKGKERFQISALPTEKEIDKATRKHIPFFPYASEDRFKDLFISLRDDAKIDSKYIVLMLLSTLIATFGLYLDSASVIIGAMLLAPLMAPIISGAMGVLRSDQTMLKSSTFKIFIGIGLAVCTSALVALIIPYQPVTGEMQGRLNPTVLDLMVAVVAGIAGAYTKSFKEILQSLAGVAIAVALVPPLATAGIGLGRFDFNFFIHAFLLFTTNLAGILVAAVITFRGLGFSSAVQARRRFAMAISFLFLISIPLYLSYANIIEQSRIERSWQEERFFVNGKYVIINSGHIRFAENARILNLELLARDQLDRADLSELRRKIMRNFGDDIVIRTRLTYIP